MVGSWLACSANDDTSVKTMRSYRLGKALLTSGDRVVRVDA
jgi:hypothetical protein